MYHKERTKNMRCLSCNKQLNDYESTRKSANTGDFLDLCNGCFGTIRYDVDTIERPDLFHASDDEDDEDYYLEDYDE